MDAGSRVRCSRRAGRTSWGELRGIEGVYSEPVNTFLCPIEGFRLEMRHVFSPSIWTARRDACVKLTRYQGGYCAFTKGKGYHILTCATPRRGLVDVDVVSGSCESV